MTDHDDTLDDTADLFERLDLDAALIGAGRPSAGWNGTVAMGQRRRRRRTGLAAGFCVLAIAAVGVLLASRGTESSTVYTNDGTVTQASGEVVYFLPPDGATPGTYMSVYTTGVYDLLFRMPDNSSWQFMSDGTDSDPNISRWSFDTNATTRWSIESTRFGTIEMSCRDLSVMEGRPKELPGASVIALFPIDGIYYSLNGGSTGSVPRDCDSAEQLNPSFLAILDGLQSTDLQTWMTWAGVSQIQEPLPNPPSTDLPN